MNSQESEWLILFCSEEAEKIYKICEKLVGFDWTEKTKMNPKLVFDDLNKNWISKLKGTHANQEPAVKELNRKKTIEFLCCTALMWVERAKFHASNKSLIPCLIAITNAKEGAARFDSSYEFIKSSIPIIKKASESAFQKSVSKFYKNAAIQRWEVDPKSKDKSFVKDCWLEWKANPKRYKSKASFARDMVDKVESLDSTKVIEDWCRKWDKEKV